MTERTTQVFRVNIRATIEEVWETLTRRDEPLPFFFGSVMRLSDIRPGATFRMRSPNGKFTGVVGDIVEWNPPHRFAHTFKFTAYDDEPCTVIYELRETQGGVEFTLTAENVPVGTKTERDMAQGGRFICKTIKGCVENGKPPFSSRALLLLIRLMTPLTPKRCRSERWP